MHQKFTRCTSLALSAGLLLVGSASLAQATEGGISSWPLGIENYGMGILPPPGTYGQLFVGNYLADTVRDNAGEKVADIDLRVTTLVPPNSKYSVAAWASTHCYRSMTYG